MKKNESFLSLSEQQVITGLVLFFAIGLLLFFTGYLWGMYWERKRNQYSFADELKNSLKSYARNPLELYSDDLFTEDFDTDSGIVDEAIDDGVSQS